MSFDPGCEYHGLRCDGYCDERMCETTGPGVGATCGEHVVCEDCVKEGWGTECRACDHDIRERANDRRQEDAWDAMREEL